MTTAIPALLDARGKLTNLSEAIDAVTKKLNTPDARREGKILSRIIQTNNHLDLNATGSATYPNGSTIELPMDSFYANMISEFGLHFPAIGAL